MAAFPGDYNNKKKGMPILSADWNEVVNQVDARIPKTGGHIAGTLTIEGTLGVGSGKTSQSHKFTVSGDAAIFGQLSVNTGLVLGKPAPKQALDMPLHIISADPKPRGLEIRNTSADPAAAAVLDFALGAGNTGAGQIGVHAATGQLKIDSALPLRVQTKSIELHVGADDTMDERSLKLLSPDGKRLEIQAVASKSTNLLAKFEGRRASLNITALNANDGWAEIRNAADNNVFQIQTIAPAYAAAPQYAGKTILTSTHDLVLAPNTGADVYFGKYMGELGPELNNIFKSSGEVGLGTLAPQERLHVAGGLLTNNAYFPGDKKFQKNIAPIQDALKKLLEISGQHFQFQTEKYKKWGLPEGDQFGVDAEKLETVFPNLVNTYDKHKAVNLPGLIPVLLEGLKSLHKKVENLAVDVSEKLNTLRVSHAALEDRILKLEKSG